MMVTPQPNDHPDNLGIEFLTSWDEIAIQFEGLGVAILTTAQAEVFARYLAAAIEQSKERSREVH